MGGKPERLQDIDKLAGSLKNVLKKTDLKTKKSLILQFGESVKHFLRKQAQGNSVMHPGMARMATWGHCSLAQARKNVRTLENYEVLRPVAFERGGGGHATHFFVDLIAIKRLLVTLEANPSSTLLRKLDRARQGLREPPPKPKTEQGPSFSEAPKPVISCALSGDEPPTSIRNWMSSSTNFLGQTASLGLGFDELAWRAHF